MDKIGIQIVNSHKGLHKGHETLIDFGKQFGEVTIAPIEDMLHRNQYLEQGIGTPRYRLVLGKLEEDCARLGVRLGRPSYIKVPEEQRIKAYNQAKAFVNLYKDFLLTERYTKQIAFSIMPNYLSSVSKTPDLLVAGPEIMHFFFKRITPLWGGPERKIGRAHV